MLNNLYINIFYVLSYTIQLFIVSQPTNPEVILVSKSSLIYKILVKALITIIKAISYNF